MFDLLVALLYSNASTSIINKYTGGRGGKNFFNKCRLFLLELQCFYTTIGPSFVVLMPGWEWDQPLLTKCPNGYATYTASDSKVLTLPSRGGTVSTSRERRKARHWHSNQLLWTDGIHQPQRQFI